MSTPDEHDVGRQAPELTLPRTDGGEMSLSSLLGTPVLVSFLSHAA